MHQLTFNLNTHPDDDRPVYIAGNFNDWNERDEAFRMRNAGVGHYVLELDRPLDFPLEYKYTRGSWDSVEANEYGNSGDNRYVEDPTPVIGDTVYFWQAYGNTDAPEYRPIIDVISERFEIPQLIKTRRIAALLPYNYHETDKHYPVLYLQDGQNLFDDHAPYGSWEVDKKLSLMQRRGFGDIIVISIDHAQEERIEEYNPGGHPRLGKGQGREYVRFLAETLKPFVDKNFRTLPDRLNTGIGGSSMGGLISIWAGFMYPELYSKLMIFSPSLWVNPNIHFHAIRFTMTMNSRVYVYAGGAESKNMLPNVQRFKNALLKQELTEPDLEIELSVDPNGKHTESRWGQEFPRAVEWLFFKEPV